MFKSVLKATFAAGMLCATVAGPALAGEMHYGFGVKPTAEQIAGWDIDIRPDGMGLPAGEGTVEDGEMLFAEQCAACHGEFGDGAGRYPPLVGGSVADLKAANRAGQPEKTIGSYWPYASTVFDYIKRAMPFGSAQSLTDSEVYALTAYLLWSNDVYDGKEPLNAARLKAVKMPNEANFFMDPRPDVHAKACMKDCIKGEVKILSRAAKVGVTPESNEDALR
ncbi:MAG: c-type cytochrome [Rhodospirillales bacterium]